MDSIATLLARLVADKHVLVGDAITPESTHDESLTVAAVSPLAVVRPANADEVAKVLAFANERRIPIVAGGAGSGLSGGATPVQGGIVLSLERMNRILEIDEANQVAVCEPFVRLSEPYAAAEDTGLLYAIMPGESSATIGGKCVQSGDRAMEGATLARSSDASARVQDFRTGSERGGCVLRLGLPACTTVHPEAGEKADAR